MVKDSRFDDIRPYYEEEIPDAMHRIADSDVLPLLASFVYPSDKMEDVRNRIRSFKTVREFQHDTMRRVNEQIIARSITDFSVSGLERLSPDKHYLFISNHRDIMLDASLLQYYFVVNGFDTTEITFGANLMMHPVVIDVGKCNKMFKVARPGGDIKEFYRLRNSIAIRCPCRNTFASPSRKRASLSGLPSETDVPRMASTRRIRVSSRCFV